MGQNTTSTSTSTAVLPILMIGGSGTVGSHATRTFRQLQPEIPIVIGARNQVKAQALANEVRNATSISIDLTQTTLGIDEFSTFSAVVVLVKDETLNSLKYAQRHKIPYISFSDFTFEVGPEVGQFIAKPQASPILLLGHHLGGIVTLTTLHFAKQDFDKIHVIKIGATFDEEDFGGPAAQADLERVAAVSPRPLIYQAGKWLWSDEKASKREFKDAHGNIQQGEAYSLLDTVSLAAQTDAHTVRIDGAVRDPLTRTNKKAAHDVVIEITGITKDGTTTTRRYGIITNDVHQAISGQGAALAIERLLGIHGQPVSAGMYFPESIQDASYVVDRVRELGATIKRLS